MTVNFAEDWLQLENALGERPTLPLDVTEMRKGMNEAAKRPPQKYTYATPSAVEMFEEVIETSSNAALKLRIYKPPDCDGTLPMGYYAHGGGMCLGNLDTDDALIRSLCSFIPAVMVQVDYRLAPESKWPSMFEDAYEGFLWAASKAAEWNVDQNKIFVAGESAGGNLAAAIALKDRDDKKFNVNGQVLIQPMLVMPEFVPEDKRELFTRSTRIGADGAFVNSETVKYFWSQYKPVNERYDKYIFPFLHPNHSNLPPTFITYNGEDVLGDDGMLYAESLKANGVKVDSKEYPGYPHCWFIFSGLGKADLFFTDFTRAIQYVLGI